MNKMKTVNEKMGYTGRKKKRKTPPFVATTWKLLNSAVYKELNFSARIAYVYFSGKTHRFPAEPDYHDVEIEFTYAEAENLGFSRGAFFGVIKSLVHYGFIDPVVRGGKRGFGYSNSIFKMSTRWNAWGTHLFIKREWTEVELQKTNSRSKNERHKYKKRLEKTVNGSIIKLVEAKNGL